MIPVTFRNQWNVSGPGTRMSRHKRASAVGTSVLMTSALALPVGMAAASVGDSGVVAQAYSNMPDSSPASKRLQAVMAAVGPLGITGALPRNSLPSSALLAYALNLAKFAASAGRGGLRSRKARNIVPELAGGPAALANGSPGPLGIPGVVLLAYRQAQQIMATQRPGCHLPWWLLAGIGQVESGQADGGLVDAQGNTLTPILGPALDGANGTAVLRASGGGWERAVGPMQFLPSTWSIWGDGGNPNNVYDAALAAGRYLCAGGWNLSDPAQQAMAVFSYNHSDSYVQEVLTWAYAYAGGVNPLPIGMLPPGGQNPTAPRTPARPSRRPRPAARSTSSAKATSSPSPSSTPHPRSSSPAPLPAPTTTIPAPVPIPSPSLPPLPTPTSLP